LKNIKTIMAHSQNFRQCQQNLKEKYSNMELITGKGNLMDTAKVANALSISKIPKETAILGPEILAKIYDFDIIDSDLQDSTNNLTTFFLVSR